MNIFCNEVYESEGFVSFDSTFRLNRFDLHVVDMGNVEYSVWFDLPSREVCAFRRTSEDINPSLAHYDIIDLDGGAIFDAFNDYNLGRVYELAKTITQKIVNDWEAQIENAE